MKKRILILLILILFTTGCSCEYNLTIDDYVFKEEIKIKGENKKETELFEREYTFPVDKDNCSGADDSIIGVKDNIYKYKISDNTLIFNYDFTINNYSKSTAVSKCYRTLNVSKANSDKIIISTNNKNNCYENYPDLTNLTVNITVDREVISSDADEINGRVYTWYITKENANNKSINLMLKDENKVIPNTESKRPSSSSNKQVLGGYNELYIFCIILAIIFICGYFLFSKIQKINNKLDD